MKFTKLLLPLFGALFMLVEPWLVGQQTFTAHDWINVANVGAGLIIAAVASNNTATIGYYAKEIGIGVTAALVALNNVVDGGVTQQELWQIVVAAGIALGAFVVPTSQPRSVVPGGAHAGDAA